ncbi:15234_t:CDS:2 [Rhizophagus irregularis]|nr:15234_t:CDS:2 [Rhizophagus irregularis]
MEDAGSIRPANGCSMNYTAWAYTIGLEGVDRSPSGGKSTPRGSNPILGYQPVLWFP